MDLNLTAKIDILFKHKSTSFESLVINKPPPPHPTPPPPSPTEYCFQVQAKKFTWAGQDLRNLPKAWFNLVPCKL